MKTPKFFLLPLAGIMLAAGVASAQVVASGTTGSCTWALTGVADNLTLTISGTGAMGNYSLGGGPWHSDNIKALSIGQGVTSIGEWAFYGCSGLTSVSIPASVTAIGIDAFCGCSSLTAINVEATNTSYVSENGVVFNKSKTTLICFPGGKTGDYTIPSSVTAIGNDAFARCSELTSVTIPSSVTTIGEWAFWDCGLTSIIIPSSVTSIDYGTFYECSALTSITIPASVTSIGSYAFYRCSELTSVTIPEVVTSIGARAFSRSGLTSVTIPALVTAIGESAFAYCESLTSVTNISLTPQNIDYSVFDDVNKATCRLLVPPNAIAAYQSADVWKDFQNIQAMATGVSDQLQASVSLYPNPFTAEVRLTGAAGCTLTVITAAGAAVHTQAVGSAAESIALAQLPAGVYFFRLEKDGKSCTVKGYKR